MARNDPGWIKTSASSPPGSHETLAHLPFFPALLSRQQWRRRCNSEDGEHRATGKRLRRQPGPPAGVACSFGQRAAPSSGSGRRPCARQACACGRPRDGDSFLRQEPAQQLVSNGVERAGRAAATGQFSGQQGCSGSSPSTPSNIRRWLRCRRGQRRRRGP